MYRSGKIFQATNNQLQFAMLGGFIRQLATLLIDLRDTAAHTEDAWFKLVFVNEALGVTVDQARQTLPQLAKVRLDGVEGGAPCARVWLEPAPIFLREPLWMRQQRTDFLPDGHVQEIRPHLRILTDALAAKAVRVRAQAAVIGVRAGLAFPGAGAEPFPIVGIAAVLTLHQALQQIQRAAGRLPGVALIFPQWLLDSSTDLGLHESRHGKREPLLLRHVHRGDGPAGGGAGGGGVPGGSCQRRPCPDTLDVSTCPTRHSDPTRSCRCGCARPPG